MKRTGVLLSIRAVCCGRSAPITGSILSLPDCSSLCSLAQAARCVVSQDVMSWAVSAEPDTAGPSHSYSTNGFINSFQVNGSLLHQASVDSTYGTCLQQGTQMISSAYLPPPKNFESQSIGLALRPDMQCGSVTRPAGLMSVMGGPKLSLHNRTKVRWVTC